MLSTEKFPAPGGRTEEGFVLVTSLLLCALLTLMALVALAVSTGEIDRTGLDRRRTQAFYAADAGLQRAQSDIHYDYATDPDRLANRYLLSPSGPLTDATGSVTGVPGTRYYNLGSGVPSASYYDLPYNDTDLLTGRYQVELKNTTVLGRFSRKRLSTRAQGTSPTGVEETLEADFRMGDVSLWDNVVAVGDGRDIGGHGKTAIAGNAQMDGAVLVFGYALSPSDPAFAFTGTAGVANTYVNMSPEIAAHIRPLEPNETLETEVRVQHGYVGLSGNAAVGTGALPVEGVYVTDGFAGSRGEDGVFSLNGADHGWDVPPDQPFAFPSLDDPYYDAAESTLYDTYEAWLDSHALHLPSLVLDEEEDAAQTINQAHDQIEAWNPDGVTISVNVVTGEFSVTSPWGSLGWDPESEEDWDGNGQPDGNGELEISGIVVIHGDLTLGSKSLQQAGGITYDGRGTLFACACENDPGDIYIHADLLPGGIFPIDDALGLMARDDIEIATGGGDSQLRLAAAFFAEDRIVSSKQNDVAGTFAANFVDMGANVPKIHQVPDLFANLPPGIIGADLRVIYFGQVAWREAP